MANIARLCRSRAPSIYQVWKPTLQKTPFALYSSTSKKVEQSEYVIGKQTEIDPKRVQEIIDEGKRSYDEQNDINSPYYLTWGFDKNNFIDLWSKRFILFFGVSVVLVLGPVYYHFLPDNKNIKWNRAEALRVLQERREAGLPLIDPDFVSRDKIVLPDEDETSH
ncbi:putative NADH dehydrogenase [Apostichopus japonicus]|uniref:NADH dehydrogenase [ubiquinone] 1 beta subcomplex subunit 11, mitochondrial n=1 Tax=Stichopus japonicus TaxID=307972 RepID=A0A2G8KBV0_STIJA|nr:putative NADH dehydrogenase [Apostichopus japonicus]